MTPQELIRYIVINNALSDGHFEGQIEDIKTLTAEQVNEFYDELEEAGEEYDYLYELRSSGATTNIPCDYSRHYESESVAYPAPNGQWVGWTYWYGGGKHGCPEEIDWVAHAYHVDVVKEEPVTTIVRTFARVDNANR